MKIINAKKIQKKMIETITEIGQDRENTRQKFEETGDIHTWEHLIYLDGKIQGIEEFFRIMRENTK